VSSALSILARIEDYSKTVEENRKVFLRFVVNYGETIIGPSGDRIGERVNETFRMEELRGANMSDWGKGDREFPERGYILASERVYNELRDSKELSFRLLGVFELGGLPGLHRVYEVVPQS
jgi:class 3 adenylate cyclase